MRRLFARLLIVGALTILLSRDNIISAPLAQDLAINYPDITFTLREVIEVVAEYDIRHHDLYVPIIGLHGITSFEAHQIHIFEQNSTLKKMSIIHEILHVLYHKRGLTPPEEVILHKEYELYSNIFAGIQ